MIFFLYRYIYLLFSLKFSVFLQVSVQAYLLTFHNKKNINYMEHRAQLLLNTLFTFEKELCLCLLCPASFHLFFESVVFLPPSFIKLAVYLSCLSTGFSSFPFFSLDGSLSGTKKTPRHLLFASFYSQKILLKLLLFAWTECLCVCICTSIQIQILSLTSL